MGAITRQRWSRAISSKVRPNGWIYRDANPNSISPRLREESTAKPEFWGFYADYDWVVFCQIFGTMMDLPKGWPMYCRDLKQVLDENPEFLTAHITKQGSGEHNALADARWNKQVWEFLESENIL